MTIPIIKEGQQAQKSEDATFVFRFEGQEAR